MSKAYEVNFDSIVGPTHHYGGLSIGNIASMTHRDTEANPKKAALQGLEKMRLLMQLGIKQGVFPPQERPSIAMLHQLGFRGSDAEILAHAARTAPALLAACSSSSSMWSANCATVSPSADSADKRVHITPANLVNNLHRSLERRDTAQLLRRIFGDERYFIHHDPLPACNTLSDEGSANHTRLANTEASKGIQLFVFGRVALDRASPLPGKFPARQTLEASQTIARTHRLDTKCVVFAQQNPDAIDAGVFHNDDIAVGHGPIFLYHERAYVNTTEVIAQLERACRHCDIQLQAIEIKEQDLSLQEAVDSYLFNSQIVTLPDRTMALLAPLECWNQQTTKRVLERILTANTPIRSCYPVDLRQSMQNGGGPACVRLRVVLTEEELAAIKSSVLLTETLYASLVAWVHKHYRDQLSPLELADPQLLQESREALSELHTILKMR